MSLSSRLTETTQLELTTASNVLIEINSINDSNSSNLTLDKLNEKLKQLTWESWKCFGLKLTIPLIPLLLTGGGVIGLSEYFSQHPGNDEIEQKLNGEAVGLTTIGGLTGCCYTMFCYSKVKHEQQKEIDKKIKSIKEHIEITTRPRNG